MEIPSHIAQLYRHLFHHTVQPIGVLPEVDTVVLRKVEEFTHERLRMWERKIQGKQAPYSSDPILAQYRFCNIFREFDRQTIAIHTLLNPLRDDFVLWLLNVFMCRLIARPETVATIGLLSFDEKENEAWHKRLEALPRPKYGVPYVFPISVIQKSTTPTREAFLSGYLPGIMPKVAARIATWHKKSVYDGVQEVLPIFGYNLAFLWTEVLIDVAYQYPEKIDLFARFPVGPGSLPTMKRLAPSIDPSTLVQRLAYLPFASGITYEGRALVLSAENWEGIGCEFRKYTNLQLGKGRKRVY